MHHSKITLIHSKSAKTVRSQVSAAKSSAGRLASWPGDIESKPPACYNYCAATSLQLSLAKT